MPGSSIKPYPCSVFVESNMREGTCYPFSRKRPTRLRVPRLEILPSELLAAKRVSFSSAIPGRQTLAYVHGVARSGWLRLGDKADAAPAECIWIHITALEPITVLESKMPDLASSPGGSGATALDLRRSGGMWTLEN